MSFLSYIYVYVYINFLVLFTKHTNTDGDCVLAKHCNVTEIHCIASTLSLLPFPFAFYTFSVVSQYVFFFCTRPRPRPLKTPIHFHSTTVPKGWKHTS